jgi:hypothetical protein
LRTVVLVVRLASVVGFGALGRRNPQIGRTGVIYHLKVLWWSSNADWSVVLSILIVGQRNRRQASFSEFGQEICFRVSIVQSGEFFLLGKRNFMEGIFALIKNYSSYDKDAQIFFPFVFKNKN